MVHLLKIAKIKKINKLGWKVNNLRYCIHPILLMRSLSSGCCNIWWCVTWPPLNKNQRNGEDHDALKFSLYWDIKLRWMALINIWVKSNLLYIISCYAISLPWSIQLCLWVRHINCHWKSICQVLGRCNSTFVS